MKSIKSIWLRVWQITVLVFITTTASAQLQAGFSGTPRLGCPPLVVNFKDLSTGNPSSWKWDLGNGTISFLQNPTATYFNAGTYNVKLLIKNENGADSVVQTKYIVVNALPVPSFVASDITGCYPLKVHFTDSSKAGSGTITGWQWDFGDGTLSTLQNPVHTYTHSGSFTVVLNVINSNGCSKVYSKSSFIKILNGVTADFTYAADKGCHTPTAVTFTNTTEGTGTTNYQWNFGDGNTSLYTNPVNNYQQQGKYTVKLIATNSFGCSDTMNKPNAIDIGFAKADFPKPDSVCAGNPFKLTNTSNPSSFVSSFWDFNDGTTSNTANPVHTYTVAGTHRIKLVTDFGLCRDSLTKDITVSPKPVVGFTAMDTASCRAPLTVTFNNTSNTGVSFLWTFGDGSTSTLQNPVHTYTIAGEYDVTLLVRNAAGCFETLTKKQLVKIIPPKIIFINNLPVKGCIPYTANPVAVINDTTSVYTYLWQFGDGATSTQAAPLHTYTVSGNYDVKLTVTSALGCTDTLTIVKAVQVGMKPLPEFSADPLDVCAFTPVNFTDLSTGPTANDWFWTFGDGGTSIDQNPVHQYNDTGYFNVSLVVFNYGCSDTLTKIKYIHVRPPIAKFDTAFFCNDPLKRNFINNSVGAESWLWDFGDGSTSDQEKVSHIYATPGVYQVSLKVSNGVCEHTTRKKVVVVKERGTLEINNLINCTNTRIIYNIANINGPNILTYTWYFSGLSQAAVITGNNPVATSFSTPGVRSSAAVITDILNCRDTMYAAVPVTIYGPKAAFISTNSGTCFGNTVNFIDSSKTDGIHPVVKWTWNYGEGPAQSYTSAPFSHDYSATGTYNVMLTVKDSYGCPDSILKPFYVSITKPVAGFTPSDSMLCPNTAITFTNKSVGLGVTYLWNFDDKTTSAAVSPVHTFAQPGTYIVKLLMTDKNGCRDSASRVIKVFTAKADFTLDTAFTTCPPLVVTATNKSSNFTTYTWDFDDGGNSQLLNPSHIYTYPGIYNIKLTVKNNGGCSDSKYQKVEIQGPTGTFSYTPFELCNPGKVDAKVKSLNSVSYIWDYNDGTVISTIPPLYSHTYVDPGLYLPKTILKDANGCLVPIVGKDTIKVNGIETYMLSDRVVLCDSGYVAFRDSTVSNDLLNTWTWNFGDNTTSAQRNPTHHFANKGLYTITLTATSKFGCVDTEVNQKYIKVAASPDIKIMGNSEACAPAQTGFGGGFVRTDTSAVTWNWNFGNGNTSNVQKPDSLMYTTAGTFPLSLLVINSDGCSDSARLDVIIHPKPVVDAGLNAGICRFKAYTLNATGADKYTWNTNSSLSCTNCASPLAKPTASVTYYVTGTTIYGCTNKDSVAVSVKQPFVMTVDRGDTLCKGESFVLKAAGAEAYQWTPSLWLDNPAIATPKSTPDSTITYQVVGKDTVGCFSDTGTVRLKVYPIPKIEITNGDNIVVQVGSSVKLSTKNSPDITKWKWYPGQWLSCGSCSGPVAAPKDNVTYNVIASNPGNCEATDAINIKMICNNANVYIPNTFSPNGDGTNNFFYPRGTGLYNIKSFKIFNRWGQIVFSKEGISANNQQDGWDGTVNGRPAPTDVYVYILEVVCTNNVIFPFKGNISLIR